MLSQSSNHFKHSTHLELLGTRIFVCCSSSNCLRGICEYFPNSIRNGDQTPDVILYIDLREADRYLFRSRPEESETEMEGVWFQANGMKDPAPWSFPMYPPLPPLALSALRNRFVGFHSATVEGEDGLSSLIAGDREAGKSSLSRLLVNVRNYALLSDETTYLFRRSCIAEPLIVATGLVLIEKGEKRKVRTNAAKVYRSLATKPSPIKNLLFLQRRPDSVPSLQRIPQVEAFRLLCAQSRDVGSEIGEGISTVNRLSKLPAAAFSYSHYSQLEENLNLLDAYLKDERIKT
ncbi:hypothetical protein EBR25_13860 [bacterium]|nr:hypothetical protein [bacterium]